MGKSDPVYISNRERERQVYDKKCTKSEICHKNVFLVGRIDVRVLIDRGVSECYVSVFTNQYLTTPPSLLGANHLMRRSSIVCL